MGYRDGITSGKENSHIESYDNAFRMGARFGSLLSIFKDFLYPTYNDIVEISQEIGITLFEVEVILLSINPQKFLRNHSKEYNSWKELWIDLIQNKHSHNKDNE